MVVATTLFRARVPARRLKNASKILDCLGMKPRDAFNIFLAQVEIHSGLPFDVKAAARPLLSAEDQGKLWNDSLGEY